ncbi:MAG TPA: phosphotransferase family protein [Solirubrobacterales bacterium]|nr:phosphotransferase family protein [Solirubrobacterales bacterium]
MSDRVGAAGPDVVRTVAGQSGLELEPLLVLEPLEAFLDDAGLGSGPIEASAIGGGHSNVTYLLRRGEESLVLRRPPRGPLPPSAHDVLREARLLSALGPLGFRVPEVLATCEDGNVIGAPFYVMPFVAGHVLTATLPPEIGDAGAPARIAEELVDCLVELHAIDVEGAGLAAFGRADGYLERQIKRFGGLLELNATRPLPDLERLAEWLAANIPDSPAATVVHGDYRLGNVMFAPSSPRLVAVLDWEMATIGDPLADVGYMTAMWAQPDDPPNPVGDLSEVTRLPGFPGREALAERYVAATGLSLDALGWYQVLALWKAAIFLEGSYKRYQAGTTVDTYFARLGEGVEKIGRLAYERAGIA